jgi:hypothetical protein
MCCYEVALREITRYELLKKHLVIRKWRKCRFEGGTNVFVVDERVSMTVLSVGDCQLRKMTKNSGVKIMLFEVTGGRVFKRY